MQSIPRLAHPDVDSFLTQYVARRKPVVLTGVMDGWKARSRWTLDSLKALLPHGKVDVVALPASDFDGRVQQKPVLQEFAFGDFIQAIAHPESVDNRVYSLHDDMVGALAALKQDFAPPPYFPTDQLFQASFIAGPAGYVVRAHYDVPNNFLAQVYGRKSVVLFPPSELYRMYPYPAYTAAPHFTQVDIDKPDPLRHPRFRTTHALETVLEPGEMLYIPSCWWHHIRYLTPTIGVNFFYKLPLLEMLRLNVLRCVGMVLHQPESWRIFSREEKA